MGWLSDLLKEFPLLSAAREQQKDGEKQPHRREAGTAPSPEGHKQPISDKKGQQQTQEGPNDIFVREKGVLWKRHPSGGFQEKPYCPSCKLELNPFPPGSDDMLACPKCNFIAIFRPSKSREVLAKLNETIPR